MFTLPQANEPFLRIRSTPTVHVEGLPRCFLGHTLPDLQHKSEGIFAEWHWDGREVVVRNDRYGFQPLFYFEKPGELCLAQSLWTLLEHGAPRELDWQALAVFFRLGFFLGEHTPFRAIKTVPANVAFRWSSAGLRMQGNPPRTTSTSALDRNQAVRDYQELFASAVKRRAADAPFGVLLSGGRDSRHIVLELCRQGKKPGLAATVNLGSNSDGVVSARIARELGLNYLRVPPTPASVRGELVRNRETHFCADEHGWIFGLRDALEGRVAILYDGLGGDVLSAGLFLNAKALRLMRARQFTELARNLVAEEKLGPFIDNLFVDAADCFDEKTALANIASELEAHADAPNPMGSFYFWNRTRREIALSPFSILRKFRVYVPFLDYELYDFLTGLPAEHFLDHTFHDQAIAQGYPQWSHLAYSTKSQDAVCLRNLVFAWQAASWLCRHRPARIKLRHLLPRLLRAGLDPWYSRNAVGNLTALPIYWTLLEEISAGKMPAQKD